MYIPMHYTMYGKGKYIISKVNFSVLFIFSYLPTRKKKNKILKSQMKDSLDCITFLLY